MQFEYLDNLSYPESDWAMPRVSKLIAEAPLSTPEEAISVLKFIDRTFNTYLLSNFINIVAAGKFSLYNQLILAHANYRIGAYHNTISTLDEAFRGNHSDFSYNLRLRSVLASADQTLLYRELTNHSSDSKSIDRANLVELSNLKNTLDPSGNVNELIEDCLVKCSWPDLKYLAHIDKLIDAGYYEKAYELAVSLRSSFMPSHFSISAVTTLNHWFPSTIDRRVKNSYQQHNRAGQISLRLLTHWGRFGQQLTEYLTARSLADSANLSVQTPTWIGEVVFELNDEPLSLHLPRLAPIYKLEERVHSVSPLSHFSYDVNSPGQLLNWTPDTTALARKLFRIRKPIESYLQERLQHSKVSLDRLIGIHYRATDQESRFDLPDLNWYSQWANTVSTNDQELEGIYFASDDPESYLQLLGSKLKVFTWKMLGIPEELSWLADFFVLSKTKYTAISHSAFSAMAAILNANNSQTVQPNFDRQMLSNFDLEANSFTRLAHRAS